MVEREVDLRRSTSASVVGPPRLAPRGPLSAWLIEHLARPVHRLPAAPPTEDDPLDGEDSALALYLCYELHYRGLPGVDDAWEWEPSLLAVRRRLEDAFLDRLVALVGRPDDELSPLAMREELVRLASTDGGPSLSAYMAGSGTTQQLREFCVHRSLYQLKEADPHTFAIPRLWGPAKAAMVAIQVGEYGDGRADRVHAHLFGETMAELGLDPAYGAYLPVVPATTLATVCRTSASTAGGGGRRSVTWRCSRCARSCPWGAMPAACAGSASASRRRTSTTSTCSPTRSTRSSLSTRWRWAWR
jgi:hypothetical protein